MRPPDESETLLKLGKILKKKRTAQETVYKGIDRNKKKAEEHCISIAKSSSVADAAVARFMFEPLTMYLNEAGLKDMEELESCKDNFYDNPEAMQGTRLKIWRQDEKDRLDDMRNLPGGIFDESDNESLHPESLDTKVISSRSWSRIQTPKAFSTRSAVVVVNKPAVVPKRRLKKWEPLSLATMVLPSIYPSSVYPKDRERNYTVPKTTDYLENL